jgi:hypothetical protein
MKRRQKKSGQAGKKIAPWRFEEQMSFLKPYLEGRPTTGNLQQEVDLDNCTMSSEDSLPFLESPISPESNFSSTSTPTSNASYKRKASSGCDNYLGDMIEMMKTSQENRMKKQEMDDLDTFFLSISKTMKKLPKLDQIKIKMDLLKAVSEAEVKQLEAQQNTLRTPITIKRQTSSLAQPHTSYSSPIYLAELPNTKVSFEAANQIRSPGHDNVNASDSVVVQPRALYTSPPYIVELPNTQVSSDAANDEQTFEAQNIRRFYENSNLE